MLTEVVVFPVPPLWLKIARRAGACMRERRGRARRRGGRRRRRGDVGERGRGRARRGARSDGAEALAVGLGEDLLAALLRARVPELAADAHDLRHQLDVEPLLAGVARRAAGRLAAHGLLVALVGAEEREAPVALLHLVAELNVEPLRADAAALGHRSHRPSQVP